MEKDFYAGLYGGISGVFISHPIDTLRIRIQTGQKNIFNHVYKGITPPLIGVGLEKFLVFGNYEKFKSWKLIQHQDLNNFTSGMLSGVFCTSIVTPLERLKINFQNVNSNMETKMRLMRKTTNLPLLYKGWSSTLIREVPGYGIYFGLYEMMKRETKEFKWYYSFVYGGISGMGSWVFIYPSDVIKTRMQLEGNEGMRMRDCIKQVYQEGGVKRFYRGFNLAIMRAGVLHAGVFAGYEFYMKYF